MPLSSTTHASKHLIVTRAGVSLNLDNFLQHYGALPKQPEYDAHFDEIVDLTEVATVDLSAQEIQRFAQMPVGSDDEPVNVKIAVIAPGDLEFALARMYEMYASGNPTLTVSVFRDRRDAEAWIGVSPG